jgi:ABC-2 type transport system permease protein
VASATSMRLGVDYTGPSNLTLFVIITSMTSAAALVESRIAGITRRMFAMPVARFTVLAGESLGRFVIAVIQAVVILAFCTLVFGVDWGNPVAVAALTLCLCLFGACLGMLVGLAAKTINQVIAFGPPAGVALGMLGGCMWPLSIVGSAMRTIGHITPNAWAMDGYVALINSNAGILNILRPIAVLAGMAALALAAASGLVRARRIL